MSPSLPFPCCWLRLSFLFAKCFGSHLGLDLTAINCCTDWQQNVQCVSSHLSFCDTLLEPFHTLNQIFIFASFFTDQVFENLSSGGEGTLSSHSFTCHALNCFQQFCGVMEHFPKEEVRVFLNSGLHGPAFVWTLCSVHPLSVHVLSLIPGHVSLLSRPIFQR